MIDMTLPIAMWGKPQDLPTSSNPKVFTSSTTWTCPWSGNWSVTCIGGGGKGGAYTKRTSSQGSASSTDYTHLYNGGAGGGAGYVTTQTVTLVRGQSYAVTVGAAAGASKFASLVTANAGGNASGVTKGTGGAAGGAANGSWSQFGVICFHKITRIEQCAYYSSYGSKYTTLSAYNSAYSCASNHSTHQSKNYYYKRGSNGAGGNNNSGYGKGGNGGYVTKGLSSQANATKHGFSNTSLTGSTAGFHSTAANPATVTSPTNGAAGAVKIYYAGP